MKKSILVLFVAFIASATVMGQAPNITGNPTCPTPVLVTCLPADALHPVPGTLYNYEVNVPTPPGTKYYNWLVTQDQTFIQNSVLIATPEPNNGTGLHIQATGVGYNDPGAPPVPGTGTNNIDITWKSWTHDPTQPVFLVIYVLNDDQCITDNIQVYMIEPVHAFTLDLANIGSDGSAQADLFTQCVAHVASSSWNPATGIIEMDFGINYMFFAVTAANWTDSWMPSFQINGGGMHDSREVVAVDWAYPAEAQTGTWHVTATGGFGGAGSTWIGADPIMATGGPGSAVGPAGECIIVRITIENNQVETLTDDQISLAVDGIMLDPGLGGYVTAGFGDIHHTFGPGGECPYYDGYQNDVITQVLSARPEVIPVDPTPFIPTNSE